MECENKLISELHTSNDTNCHNAEKLLENEHWNSGLGNRAAQLIFLRVLAGNRYCTYKQNVCNNSFSQQRRLAEIADNVG